MEQSIFLLCLSSSLVKGKLVKAGQKAAYPKSQALSLISTNRFKKCEEEEATAPTSNEADEAGETLTNQELKDALDEIGVEYAAKATKAELTALLAEAESND